MDSVQESGLIPDFQKEQQAASSKQQEARVWFVALQMKVLLKKVAGDIDLHCLYFVVLQVKALLKKEAGYINLH